MPGDLYSQMFELSEAMRLEMQEREEQRNRDIEQEQSAVCAEQDKTLQRLFSVKLAEKWKWVTIASIALVRGRAGRMLLRRVASVTVIFIYEYLVVVELIIALVIFFQLAARLLRSSWKAKSNVASILYEGTEVLRSPIRSTSRTLSLLRISSTVSRSNYAIVQQPNQDMTLAVPVKLVKRKEVVPKKKTTITVASGSGTSKDNVFDLVPFSQNRPAPLRSIGQPASTDGLLIHFQLPIYVCNLVFWNNIYVTLSQGGNHLPHSAWTPPKAPWLLQIKMTMVVEANPASCFKCECNSHSVGKRKFQCTNMKGELFIHKNTFHAGHKMLFVKDNVSNPKTSELNFTFETRVEQISGESSSRLLKRRNPGEGSTGSTFKQEVTFKLLPSPATKPPRIGGLNIFDRGNKEHQIQARASHSRLLSYLPQRKKKSPPLEPEMKCDMEAIYKLEDNTGHNPGTGTVSIPTHFQRRKHGNRPAKAYLLSTQENVPSSSSSPYGLLFSDR